MTDTQIMFYTVAVDTGSADDIYSKEEMLWLAEQHALEADRLINEASLSLSAQRSNRVSNSIQMAQSHAQIASALAAIAAQK